MAAATPDPRPKPPAGRRRKIAGEEWLVTRAGSPWWHYDFSIGGDRLRGSCGTADHAAAAAFAAAERERTWRRIQLGEREKPRLTLNEAFVRWYEDKGKDSGYGKEAQRYFLARILRVLGPATDLRDLDDACIARLVRGLRDGEGATEEQNAKHAASSPATVNRYLSTLRVVCKYATEILGAEAGTWEKAKHTMKEPEGRERFLGHDTAGQVLRTIIPHARPLVFFDLLTGLRKGNLTGLQWENVSFDLARAVMIQKGDRRLTISLTQPALALLAFLEPEPARRTGPVFVYGREQVACRCPHCASHLYRGRQIQDFRRSFRTATKAAGVPDARIHDLRHTFASWLLTDGGDLRLVGEALGHRNLQTTMRYAHLMPGRKEAAIASATAHLALPFGQPAEVEQHEEPGARKEGTNG
jgi:integrase